MALKMRGSKFRHVFGVTYKREQTFENVRITRNTHDSNFCAVNPRFLAVVTESSGGGSFVVLDVNRPGRVDVNCPRVCGHAGAVMDIKWSPFDDYVIASGSEDATVKIWCLPQKGIFGTLTNWSADLHGHSRRVAYLDWHPTASGVLMSVGFDYKIMVWNVEQAEPITSLSCHRDTIYSASWGRDGALIATTNKDKKIRILDPRTAYVALEMEGHQSAKASKIMFVTDNAVFTTGFSRTSNRQYALWDVRRVAEPLMMVDLDCSSGILLPYYDPDTKVVYLAGKGDGNIRYFEIVPEAETVQFLNTFQSPLPQRGLGMMPKRGVDSGKNELARFYKLHASKNLVEPVSMIVPRKAEGFQPDLFPPTASKIPSLTADEWTSGINRGPILLDLESGTILDKPRSSMSPAVQPQLAALSKTPQITTYKAVSKSQYPSAGQISSSSSASSLSAAHHQQQQQQPPLPTLPSGQMLNFANVNNNNNNNISNAYSFNQSQQPVNHSVPFYNPSNANISSGADPSSSSLSQSRPSTTAKAFNSAQAFFNQPSVTVTPNQSTSPTHHGHVVPPNSLRTASTQGWPNGRGDEGQLVNRQDELASIKNIRRLSRPTVEDVDSDSPLSTASSVSLGSLGSQGQGRPVSRSPGSPISSSMVLTPPPPSPSSTVFREHTSNGFGTQSGNDHLRVPHATHHHSTPDSFVKSPSFHLNTPESFAKSPSSYLINTDTPETFTKSLSPLRTLSPGTSRSQSMSPTFGVSQMTTPDVDAVPFSAVDESCVDTASTPFKAALASFNKPDESATGRGTSGQTASCGMSSTYRGTHPDNYKPSYFYDSSQIPENENRSFLPSMMKPKSTPFGSNRPKSFDNDNQSFLPSVMKSEPMHMSRTKSFDNEKQSFAPSMMRKEPSQFENQPKGFDDENRSFLPSMMKKEPFLFGNRPKSFEDENQSFLPSMMKTDPPHFVNTPRNYEDENQTYLPSMMKLDTKSKGPSPMLYSKPDRVSDTSFNKTAAPFRNFSESPSEAKPYRPVSGLFRQASFESPPASTPVPPSNPYPQPTSAKISSLARLSAERGSPIRSSPIPKATPTPPPPDIGSPPPQFVRLRDQISSSPPAQQKSFAKAPMFVTGTTLTEPGNRSSLPLTDNLTKSISVAAGNTPRGRWSYPRSPEPTSSRGAGGVTNSPVATRRKISDGGLSQRSNSFGSSVSGPTNIKTKNVPWETGASSQHSTNRPSSAVVSESYLDRSRLWGSTSPQRMSFPPANRLHEDNSRKIQPSTTRSWFPSTKPGSMPTPENDPRENSPPSQTSNLKPSAVRHALAKGHDFWIVEGTEIPPPEDKPVISPRASFVAQRRSPSKALSSTVPSHNPVSSESWFASPAYVPRQSNVNPPSVTVEPDLVSSRHHGNEKGQGRFGARSGHNEHAAGSIGFQKEALLVTQDDEVYDSFTSNGSHSLEDDIGGRAGTGKFKNLAFADNGWKKIGGVPQRQSSGGSERLSKDDGDITTSSGGDGSSLRKGRKARPYWRAHTVGGVDSGAVAEHISAVRMVLGSNPSSPPTDAAGQRNAIHIRKVWSPPDQAVTSPTSQQPAGVISFPNTDPELKKAYFRQLEEIRALQEQLHLKDRRIAQLEAELHVVRDKEEDLHPGESNC